MTEQQDEPEAPFFLTGGGEMGALMRACDWTGSPLGDPAAWPQSLKAVVALMINSRYPMFVAWGPQLSFLYNDSYAPIFGAKHPHMFGQPFREAWADIWDDISPLIEKALEGEATFQENMHLVMQRNGYPEDTWYSFSYSPVRDETGKIAGMFCACTETTRQVLAERQRAAVQERQQQMLRQMPGFVAMMTGPDLVYTYVNEAYVAITERSDFIGRPFRDIFPDVEGQGYRELFEQVFHAGKGVVTRGMEMRLHGRDEPQYVDFVLEPIRDDYGVVTGVFVGGYETTELHRGNQALRERAEELETVLDAVPAAIWIARNADSRDIVGNQMSYDVLRLRSGTNLSLSADESERPVAFKVFHGGRELSVDELPVQRAATGVAVERFEEEIRFDDGSVTHLYGNASPLYDADGSVRGAVAAFVDVSEVKAAQAALLEGEERYRALFDSLDTGFCIIEVAFDEANHPVDYCFAEINPAFARLTGIEDGEGRWMREIAPDQEQYWFDIYGDVVLTGNPIRFESEAAALGRWFGVYAYRVGEPGRYRAAVLFNDITDRKRAEAALRDLTETLEHRVEERTLELLHAQEALRQSQKLEAMGQLTGGVAHDFNNLLTPIVGTLDMLQRSQLGGDRERRLIDGAVQSADRARTLVQRLLAFARRQPLTPSAIDLGSLIEGMAGLVASTSGPQIKVLVNSPHDLQSAFADANQLEMAILNLAVNARDAMPEGGTLSLSAENERLDQGNRAALPPGDYVRLSVADTGTGMSDVTLARAIEPFFSTKGIGKGTGLGLSMVHGLALQLGGAMTLSSEPGLGTKVELWLPVSDRVADQPAPDTGGEPSNGTGAVVLLVDDEGEVRASTADMLEQLGYAVVEADSATKALELLDDGFAPDLLLTDHLMPGMTGADFAREVRGRWPDRPILLITGFAEVDDVAPDLPRLTKPFRLAELSATLAELTG